MRACPFVLAIGLVGLGFLLGTGTKESAAQSVPRPAPAKAQAAAAQVKPGDTVVGKDRRRTGLAVNAQVYLERLRSQRTSPKVARLADPKVMEIAARKKFDVRQEVSGINPSDQGDCGSCWAYATVAVYEINWLYQARSDRRFPATVSPSEQYILDFAARRHATTCKDGEIASFGPDFLKDDEGTVSRTFAPATADGHPQAFHSAPKDEPRFKAADWSFVQAATNHADFAPVETSLIKQAIAKYGAVYVGMVATDAFGDFQNQPETATFAENVSPALLPDHAVVLLGWDETDGRNAWLVKNSWAKTNWGNNGFGYVRFGSDNIGSQALWIEAAPPVNGPGDIFGGNPEILRRIDYWEKSPFSRFVPKP